MAVAGNAEWRRRAELTSLLQACRSRMARPVPHGTNSGLRQEDAADLAGLSVRRYASFERGEIMSPLPEMVESVASALHMTAAERSVLHVLATGHDPPLLPVPPDGARAEISPVFLELLARQDPSPAIITDETWTVIARNEAMSAWVGAWLDQEPSGQQNLVLYLFSADCEALMPDVHAVRRATIAGLRYQYARNITSDRFASLVARLQETARRRGNCGTGMRSRSRRRNTGCAYITRCPGWLRRTTRSCRSLPGTGCTWSSSPTGSCRPAGDRLHAIPRRPEPKARTNVRGRYGQCYSAGLLHRHSGRFMLRATVRSLTQGGGRLTESLRKRDTICPSWCQLSSAHVAGSSAAGETTHVRLVREIVLGEIDGIRAAARQPVRVEVEAFADLDGCEYPPTVRLALSSSDGPDPDRDDLTPAEARELASALLEAARIAES